MSSGVKAPPPGEDLTEAMAAPIGDVITAELPLSMIDSAEIRRIPMPTAMALAMPILFRSRFLRRRRRLLLVMTWLPRTRKKQHQQLIFPMKI